MGKGKQLSTKKQGANTAQHSTAQHSTAQHSTAQHSTAQHIASYQSTAQHSSLFECGLTWWHQSDLPR